MTASARTPPQRSGHAVREGPGMANRTERAVGLAAVPGAGGRVELLDLGDEGRRALAEVGRRLGVAPALQELRGLAIGPDRRGVEAGDLVGVGADALEEAV